MIISPRSTDTLVNCEPFRIFLGLFESLIEIHLQVETLPTHGSLVAAVELLPRHQGDMQAVYHIAHIRQYIQRHVVQSYADVSNTLDWHNQ